MNEGRGLFCIANASKRPMRMQLVMISPTYTDSSTLTSYTKALSTWLTIVTRAATTTSCTTIRMRLGTVLRMMEMIRLLNAVMTVTASPITRAGFSCDVTANAEQMPSTWISTGFMMFSGAMKTSFILLSIVALFY